MLALFGAASEAAGTTVEMRRPNELIYMFLEWSQGLKTAAYVGGQAHVIILATVFSKNIEMLGCTCQATDLAARPYDVELAFAMTWPCCPGFSF